MKLNRIFFEVLLLTLIMIERPIGRPTKSQKLRPLGSPMGLMSNCQRLLYLPEPARRDYESPTPERRFLQ